MIDTYLQEFGPQGCTRHDGSLSIMVEDMTAIASQPPHDCAGRVKSEQVGGSHYLNQKIQPWDIIDANGLDFYEGNALKYLLRWRHKGGIEDLKKCAHYVQKLIELENGK